MNRIVEPVPNELSEEEKKSLDEVVSFFCYLAGSNWLDAHRGMRRRNQVQSEMGRGS